MKSRAFKYGSAAPFLCMFSAYFMLTVAGFVLAALIHSGLPEALRNNSVLLYGMYAVLAFALTLCHYFPEPYFIYVWRQTKNARDVPPESRAETDAFSALSGQERVLADLILWGCTESVIALEMNITLNTRKSYRKNLHEGLGVHSKRAV